MTMTNNTHAASGAANNCTILPDGSAFAVTSFPLPKDHWLYAPREYDVDAENPKELPSPILTHALRAEVVSAIRYAIRGATMCGKETDFDPDALVQNAVYALCGPYGSAALAAPVQSDPIAIRKPTTRAEAEWLAKLAHLLVSDVNSTLEGLLATDSTAAPDMTDAYAGAREDLSIWKKRALEAEALNRKFAASVNSPSFMGEPAAPAKAALADPMQWPLPCDVKVGHVTIRKGCALNTLVTRMQVLYEMGVDAPARIIKAAPVDAAVQKQDEALIWLMLVALEHHTQQTRPIARTDDAITAALLRLNGKP